MKRKNKVIHAYTLPSLNHIFEARKADTTYVILGLGAVNIPGVIALSASDDTLKRIMSNSEVLLPEIMMHKELYLEELS